MPKSRRDRSSMRAPRPLQAAALAAVLLTAACHARRPASSAAAPRAMVQLSSLGLEGVGAAGDSMANPVLVYTTGRARVGLATRRLEVVTDTLRLYSLPAITADVTDGDVHLQLVGAGRIAAGGTVSGGPVTRVGATGHHIVLLQGGAGVRVLP